MAGGRGRRLRPLSVHHNGGGEAGEGAVLWILAFVDPAAVDKERLFDRHYQAQDRRS